MAGIPLSRQWEQAHPVEHRALTLVRVRRYRKRKEEALGPTPYYVYELYYQYPEHHALYALNGQTFYVGKGKGDRIDAHEKETRRLLTSKAATRGRRRGMSPLKHKHKVILFIWDTGGTVGKRKVARNLSEDEAFNIETLTINMYGIEKLTNEALPHKIKSPTP